MRTFDLTPLYRSTVGFDRLASILDQVMAADVSHNTYPPYNIEKTGEDAYRITLAVAGFSVDELAVTVEGGQLIVRGKQTDDSARDYLYRGIAARRFKRSFGLADGVEVRSAELHDGLLAIELERSLKDATVRTVRIADGEAAKPGQATVYDAE